MTLTFEDFTPKVPARLDDHDRLVAFKSSDQWPESLKFSLQLHYHFCELIGAWNLNPFRRLEANGLAGVDEIAEERGVSTFSFTSREGREDFLDFYGLDDFVTEKRDGAHYWVTLTNKFHPNDVNTFLDVYKSAMNNLATIEDERVRAIRNDNNKVGFICADHFAARELHELMRIKQAREVLAIGTNQDANE